MKKTLVIALMLVLCISIVGCKDSTKTIDENDTKTTNVQSPDKTEEYSISSLSDLCSFLESESLVSGTKIDMAATMIGAVEGYKYTDSKVEIYMFANDAPASVELSEFDTTITFDATKGKFAVICAEAENKDAIVSALSTLEVE